MTCAGVKTGHLLWERPHPPEEGRGEGGGPGELEMRTSVSMSGGARVANEEQMSPLAGGHRGRPHGRPRGRGEDQYK